MVRRRLIMGSPYVVVVGLFAISVALVIIAILGL